MLRKNTFLFLLVPFLLFFSSCFQVIEEINLKNDGSGEITLTLNLSQSKSKVASILLLDSIQGHKVPSRQDIQKKLDEVGNYLKQSEGISKVKKSVDFNTYIATISFSFKDISNVNNLTKKILNDQKIKYDNYSSYWFDRKKNTFERNYKYANEVKKQYNKLKEKDKDIFKSAQYTSIYRFETAIMGYNNPLARISKSKKAMMIRVPVLDIINGKVDLSNTIQLSK